MNWTEEKMGGRLQCMSTGDHFLNITPIAQTLRVTINISTSGSWEAFVKLVDTVKKKKKTQTTE